MIRGIHTAGIVLLCVAAGCTTVTRTVVPSSTGGRQELPEQAMRQLAADIEQAVKAGDRDAEIVPPEGLTIDEPGLRQAIRTRAARREVLDDFLDTGHAVEKQDGMVHIIRSKEYKNFGDRRVRDRNALLIISENNDRWTLYEGLIDANRLHRNSLDAIRQIFAEARILTLSPGQRYENSAGEIATR